MPGNVCRFSEYERTDDLIGMINVKGKSEYEHEQTAHVDGYVSCWFEAVTDGAKRKAALLHSPWCNVYPGLKPCTL